MGPLKTWIAVMAFVLISVCAQSPAAAQSAAMNYTKAYRYDTYGRLAGTISAPPTVGTSANFLATRNTYDTQGRLSKVESGVLSSWQSDTVAPASWGAAFTVKKKVNYSYDGYGNMNQETVAGSDGVVAAVAQISYDGYDRPICTAVRMDSAQWSTQTDPCTPQTTAAAGPDRVSKNVYDNLGRVIQQWEGVGTSVAAAVATKSWTSSSKLQYMVDADGNKAQMVYDGYDRLQCWIFPSKTVPTSYDPTTQSSALSSSGAVSGDCVTTGDYEKYGYDNNGNRTSLRKRDATTISYGYDALNRMTSKVVPTSATGAAGYTVNSTYDLLGHQLTATFAANGQGITNAYNGFGELTSTTSSAGGTARTISYQYDSDSDRTQVTHPDAANFTYAYDGMDRLSGLYEGAGTATPLTIVAYRTDGLLSSRSETGGSSVSYGYDAGGRLNSQSDAFSGGSGNVTWALGYNPASQITTDSRSNNSYAWTGAVAVNRNYTPNGLNQYTSAGSTNFTYDANGDLTADGTWTYTYDAENRLTHATGAGKDVTLSYDPLGRLYFVGGSNVGDVTFIYDGDALVAEYNSAGTMTNRYVHGSNAAADDPLVWYIGSAVGSSNRRYLHADHNGSIVATSDGSGLNASINTYDEYGIPASSNTGRFGYTGQATLYEIGLDYYKARIYSPTLGRFLQTDPIGYAGGENLYAYVGDDPMNESDPSGHGDPNNEQNCPQTTIDPGAGPCVYGNQDNGPDVGPDFGPQGPQDDKSVTDQGIREGSAAIKATAERSFNEDREPGGLVYVKNGQVGRTPTEWGQPCQTSPAPCSVDIANQLPNVPAGARIIFVWHGHGSAPEAHPWYNSRFSPHDSEMLKWWQEHYGVIGSLLGTPQGQIKIMYVPYGAQIVLETFERPWWSTRRKR